MIPTFPCRDCKVNTVPVDGNREYYEVWDSLWQSAGGPGVGQSDNGVFGYYLCIGCLEKRIRRKLCEADFKPFAANHPSIWLSERLNDRLRPREATRFQFFPNALADEMTARGYNVTTMTAGSYIPLY